MWAPTVDSLFTNLPSPFTGLTHRLRVIDFELAVKSLCKQGAIESLYDWEVPLYELPSSGAALLVQD
jgi:hypothetical protein